MFQAIILCGMHGHVFQALTSNFDIDCLNFDLLILELNSLWFRIDAIVNSVSSISE